MRRTGIALLLCLLGLPARADEAGEAVLRSLDETVKGGASRSLVQQTIQTSGGDERSFVLEILTSASADELLLVYTEPARVKGISFLTQKGGEETWTFSPKTRRVRKLTSSTRQRKVNGSDFSYEDFGAGGGTMGEDFSADFDGEETLDGVLCDRLLLKPKPGGPSYRQVMAWIGRAPRVLIRADYYDEREEPLKRLKTSDVRLIDGVPTPHEYVMQSLRAARSTRMQLKEIQRNAEFPAHTFTLENLQRQ